MDNISIIITEKEDTNSTVESDSDLDDINSFQDINLEDFGKLWVDKYRPQNIQDIILKKEYIDKITKWIEDFTQKKKDFKTSLLLYGPPGTGKTTIANLIFKSHNYDAIEFNASDIRNQKLINSKVKEILGKKNILDMMLNKSRKIGIIMDEIDGMSSGDRGGISELIKLMYKGSKSKRGKNIKEEYTPFICISNTVSEKKFNDIKKNSVVVKVSEPSTMSQIKLIERVCKGENIEIDPYNINYIIKQSQGDYRRLINMIQYIYLHKDKEEVKDIDEDDPDKLILDTLKEMGTKDKSFTTYECVDKILNNYLPIEDTLRLYDIDKNIIGMLFYENFINYIVKNRKDSNKDKIDNIYKIFDNYSNADLLDSNIYIKQRWELYDYNCIYKCSDSSYLINNMKKYSCNKMSNLNYSNLLNKTSLEYLNYKNMSLISQKLNLFDCSNNLIDISRILCDYLIKYDNTFEKGVNIMNNYNLSFDDVDKLMKISLYDYKKYFVSKKKKKIKNSLN